MNSSYSFHNLFLYNPYSDSTYSYDYCHVDYKLYKNNTFILSGTFHLEERTFSSYNNALDYAYQVLYNHLSDILHKSFIENQSKIMKDCYYALQESYEGMFFYELPISWVIIILVVI